LHLHIDFPAYLSTQYIIRTSHVICLALLHYHFVRNRDIRRFARAIQSTQDL